MESVTVISKKNSDKNYLMITNARATGMKKDNNF